EKEYLEEFIPEGGAAVKFLAACGDATPSDLAAPCTAIARHNNLVAVTLAASDVRVHMLDKFFNAIAAQLPWRDLILARLSELCSDIFTIPDTLTFPGFASQVAERNMTDEDYVRMTVEQRIAQSVFKDRNLARDFRI